ncbi:uncharacterized protein MONBRDRAFT_33475 [Monosiga brevicollis MX1]|uniref:Uncharacterized protein n=1 Tax=Monosiga brevicollis TaxID=81824 RepID=A9V5K5_MONBE|nr:uncharacterized protein MONBRDRAFT_33475 [Monosiga brevicollis MX1]EDQ87135.1 predicted protein [Monosiga brevicollis MX1]|eukprot:XP_001748078.1 hypothetical protein [Monosiga brevicollis MX1]
MLPSADPLHALSTPATPHSRDAMGRAKMAPISAGDMASPTPDTVATSPCVSKPFGESSTASSPFSSTNSTSDAVPDSTTLSSPLRPCSPEPGPCATLADSSQHSPSNKDATAAATLSCQDQSFLLTPQKMTVAGPDLIISPRMLASVTHTVSPVPASVDELEATLFKSNSPSFSDATPDDASESTGHSSPGPDQDLHLGHVDDQSDVQARSRRSLEAMIERSRHFEEVLAGISRRVACQMLRLHTHNTGVTVRLRASRDPAQTSVPHTPPSGTPNALHDAPSLQAARRSPPTQAVLDEARAMRRQALDAGIGLDGSRSSKRKFERSLAALDPDATEESDVSDSELARHVYASDARLHAIEVQRRVRRQRWLHERASFCAQAQWLQDRLQRVEKEHRAAVQARTARHPAYAAEVQTRASREHGCPATHRRKLIRDVPVGNLPVRASLDKPLPSFRSLASTAANYDPAYHPILSGPANLPLPVLEHWQAQVTQFTTRDLRLAQPRAVSGVPVSASAGRRRRSTAATPNAHSTEGKRRDSARRSAPETPEPTTSRSTRKADTCARRLSPGGNGEPDASAILVSSLPPGFVPPRPDLSALEHKPVETPHFARGYDLQALIQQSQQKQWGVPCARTLAISSVAKPPS